MLHEIFKLRSSHFYRIIYDADELGCSFDSCCCGWIVLMLTLYISGYNYSKKRCTNATEWFVEKYLQKHKIEIVVHHRRLLSEGVYGWCFVFNYDQRPREFEIELHNQMNVELYIQTLFHELWHVYQHVMGNLKDKCGKRLWKGIDHTETDYKDQPWEIEARVMEKFLYKEYMNLEDSQVMFYFQNRLTQP